MEKEKKRRSFSDNLLWILFLVTALYLFLSSFAEAAVYGLIRLLEGIWDTSPAVTFVNRYYAVTAGAVIILAVVCSAVKKNRFILRSFLPRGAGKNHKINVIEDTYEAAQENTVKNLLAGLFIGFLTNLACILCALIHGDISFSLNFSFSVIPVLIYALLMVFIQSSSEELWCRGYMYERICIRYPLWAAILANGLFFGGLHLFNDGVNAVALADLIICGISYSLVRWYTGSIWMVMGIHTMWNFTQNFIFGLPNSGLVSQVSLFRLEAASGTGSLVYDYGFGVEGALPALVADCLLGVVVLILAKKSGRLGKLTMSYESKAA
jgi:membrane protease YdiL (CAAX protease family)